MELVIDGITKLIYRTYHGRKIEDIRVDTKQPGREASYVFTFPPIDSSLDGWNRKMEVYLCKFPSLRGGYELFVMGLHGVTCYYLEIEEIKDFEKFHNYMVDVIGKAKTYWETI